MIFFVTNTGGFMFCRVDLIPTDKQRAEAKIAAHNKRVRAQTDELALCTAELLSAFPERVNELEFHPVRRWRFDHAWPEVMIAVEIHGGVYSGGHHVSAEGFINDRSKVNEASLLGWHVIEATTDDVHNGNLENWLSRAFEMWGKGQSSEGSNMELNSEQ